MKAITITADYTCDACEVITDQTAGSPPTGWKEGSKIDVIEGLDQETRIHICDTCLASEDAGVIASIANAFKSV